uniref:peptidylprolyl isomerase n=1 Tax=Oryza sativa subsp. japonica TaxID=39947 RepID=Q69K03_ORYSJ|nr:immunophilin/FKBP-type peptidyl-prolyl cis-trans isomerase-like [Oryza sativa Japonica Group]BAD36698.1 immunophilin/FKBP-type peptidyl-prolyl cis-trans isomerase-like [Oryza sativa Japonica Group]
MATFWGLELKPGEAYTHHSAPARLRITQAVLGSCDQGWTTLQCDTNDRETVRLCVLNPGLAVACHLELELQKDENVLLSVDGQNSIHLSGYYTCSHSGNHGRNSQKPTSKAVGSTGFNKKHQDISDKAPVIEEILDDQTVQQQQQQGVNISSKDVEPSHKNGHGQNSEWATCGNGTDDDNDNNGAMFYPSSRNKMEVDEPTGSKDNDYDYWLPFLDASVKRKASETDGENVYTEKGELKTPKIENVLSDQSVDMDQVNEQTEPNEIDDVKPTRGHKNTMEVVLPLLDSSVKRKAAEIDGEKVQIEKAKLKMPKTEDVPSDQNNANQVNEQICFKTVGSNAIDDAKLSLGHQNTLEDLDKSQELNVSQTKGQNDVADQITNQDTPTITSSDERYIFTGALETDIEQKNRGAENEQVEVHRCPFEVLDNGIKVEHLVEGNAKAKVASKGKQVCVRYCGRLINGEVIDPTNLDDDTHTFRLGAGEVIPGWDIGILGMRVGGKRRLTIPPAQGYGDVATPKIPANSWLVYEVELLEVKRAKRAR